MFLRHNPQLALRMRAVLLGDPLEIGAEERGRGVLSQVGILVGHLSYLSALLAGSSILLNGSSIAHSFGAPDREGLNRGCG
jgi:hypothetical protein